MVACSSISQFCPGREQPHFSGLDLLCFAGTKKGCGDFQYVPLHVLFLSIILFLLVVVLFLFVCGGSDCEFYVESCRQQLKSC